MAFKTVSEYQKMRRENPQEAERLLKKAANKGKDPISKANSGYSREALMRRMNRGQTPSGGFRAPSPPSPADLKRKRTGTTGRSKPVPRLPGNYPSYR